MQWNPAWLPLRSVILYSFHSVFGVRSWFFVAKLVRKFGVGRSTYTSAYIPAHMSVFALCLVGFFSTALWAQTESARPRTESPQWGEAWSRNLAVLDAGTLPVDFDPQTGHNVRWTFETGGCTYSTAIVAAGRVFIGTNNDRQLDPRITGDRSVLLCLNEQTGQLLWQHITPKIPDRPLKDCPYVGWCSPPVIETLESTSKTPHQTAETQDTANANHSDDSAESPNGRVYAVTSRDEVVCLDLAGLSNGNNGPFVDEAALRTPVGEEVVPLGPLDSDLLWVTNLETTAGVHVHQHDAAHGIPLILGDYLYINTSNGVGDTHRDLPEPDAPSLVVLEKSTGRVVAAERSGASANMVHCTWSAPAYGTLGNRDVVICFGGDGILRAFEPFDPSNQFLERDANGIATLSELWTFNPDPNSPQTKRSEYMGNRGEGPSNTTGMPVILDDRVYFGSGGDVWWGKQTVTLFCIEPPTNATGKLDEQCIVWKHPLQKHSMSTPAIADGLLYITDEGRNLFCLDALTGEELWKYRFRNGLWSSSLVADGKVYAGAMNGEFRTFRHGRTLEPLAEMKLDPVYGTPTVANETLFISTMHHLYAVSQPIPSQNSSDTENSVPLDTESDRDTEQAKAHTHSEE